MPKRWIKVNLANPSDAEYAEMVNDVQAVLRQSGQQGSVERDGKAGTDSDS